MLGADPLFVGAVGADELGQRVRAAMAGAGLDIRALQVTPGAPTGRVQVTLEGGEPSYDILPGQAYDEVRAEALEAVVPERVPLLYHGSLALRSEPSRSACDWLARRSERRFVDVNLRQPWYRPDTVLELIRGADYVKLNLDELRELADGPDDAARVAGLFANAGIREGGDPDLGRGRRRHPYPRRRARGGAGPGGCRSAGSGGRRRCLRERGDPRAARRVDVGGHPGARPRFRRSRLHPAGRDHDRCGLLRRGAGALGRLRAGVNITGTDF